MGGFRRINCAFFAKLGQLKMEREVLKRGRRIVLPLNNCFRNNLGHKKLQIFSQMNI